MRSKNIAIIFLVLFAISPMVAIAEKSMPISEQLTPADYDSAVLVDPGLTLKYTIDELTLPVDPLELDVGIPDLAGNQIYVKITDVVEDYPFSESVTGTLVRYSIGIILVNDVTFSIGEGLTALDITLPAGTATPAIDLAGVPHFDFSLFAPALFVLNNDWAEHEVYLGFAGLSVDNTGADNFIVSYDDPENGTLDATWRKSDGVLTNLYISDLIFADMNMTGITLDLSLSTSELKGVTITVGDQIDLNAEIASMILSGSGEIYTMLESNVTTIASTINSLQDKTLMRFKVTDVSGLYYTCDVSVYDFETNALKLLNESLEFNAFLGSVPILDLAKVSIEPLLSIQMVEDTVLSFPIFSPIITPDYDIYSGHMILGNTVLSVYLDQILGILTASTTISELDSLIVDGNMELVEKRKYKYMTESLGIDVTADIGSLFGELTPEVSIAIAAHLTLTENAWIGYHEDDGFLAGMRVQANVNAEFSTDLSTDTSTVPTSTITMNLDLQLTNPNYSPPDPTAAGVIPGFTWLVAIPTLLGLAALGLISRKK